MTMHAFNFKVVDSSWREYVRKGLEKIDPAYLHKLAHSKTWLPGPDKIFSAFSLPLKDVNFVLLGESPYPRQESANGYAFWDAAIKEIWSTTGLSKKVNRSTSFRNMIKMLLVAENYLQDDHVGQEQIAILNKQNLVQTNDEFFHNLLLRGFLLLNASMVLQSGSPQKDARAWYPFVEHILHCLVQKRPQVKFIILGRIARSIEKLIDPIPTKKLVAEHPYNHSFITNPQVINFFKPLHLLRKLS